MTTFPNSPRILKGGLVLLDPASARVQQIISLQYNPDSLSRTLQVQGTGENGDRSEALRLKGPAVETLKLEAEIDAADQLEFPDQNRAVVEAGIQPQLAVLESLVNPTSRQVLRNKENSAGCNSSAGNRDLSSSEERQKQKRNKKAVGWGEARPPTTYEGKHECQSITSPTT